MIPEDRTAALRAEIARATDRVAPIALADLEHRGPSDAIGFLLGQDDSPAEATVALTDYRPNNDHIDD